MVPKQRSMFGNDQYGDCVTASECFNVSAVSAYCATEYLIADATWMAFAQKYNVLNGADLLSVIQDMEQDGFHQGADTITDGASAVVDYTNLTAIQSAISNEGGNSPGCLKVGIMSSALPAGAGSQDGWYGFGAGPTGAEDHNIEFCGYGTAKFCFDALGTAVPPGVDPAKADCVLAYTWSTVGVVDMPWVVAALSEAFIRATVMLNGTPWTSGPTPPGPGPTPPPPGPGPVPPGNVLSLATNLAAGSYPVGGVDPNVTQAIQSAIATLQAVLPPGPTPGFPLMPEHHAALIIEGARRGLVRVNWLQLIIDLGKASMDYQAKNWPALAADAQAITHDLGF